MIVYLTAFVALLLVIVWGPTPARRQVIPLIGIAVLIVVGIEALRRKTAREFPEAQAGDTMNSIRAWYAERRHPAPAGVDPAGYRQRWAGGRARASGPPARPRIAER